MNNKLYSYDKIEESSLKWSSDYKKIKQWGVIEKIHGSNFSFVYDHTTSQIKYAKRTGFIEPSDHFFNYQLILPETVNKIQLIINDILLTHHSINTIIIYGELFGGIYPNIVNSVIPVQKGIYYSPNIHFIAFDIKIIYNNQTDSYLDFSKSIELFKKVNLMYTEPLEIFSSYEKTNDYNIEFNTIIPAKFGLPIIIPNKAEGIIIRSMIGRYIVKKKIPEFSETKYSDNTLNNNDKFGIGLLMITENRLNNTISKIGSFEDNQYLIYNLMVHDILDELNIKDKLEKNKLKICFMNKIKELFNK
jgi:Rnl2 family RNA ligase